MPRRFYILRKNGHTGCSARKYPRDRASFLSVDVARGRCVLDPDEHLSRHVTTCMQIGSQLNGNSIETCDRIRCASTTQCVQPPVCPRSLVIASLGSSPIRDPSRPGDATPNTTAPSGLSAFPRRDKGAPFLYVAPMIGFYACFALMKRSSRSCFTSATSLFH
jgi:hypothetical protein